VGGRHDGGQESAKGVAIMEDKMDFEEAKRLMDESLAKLEQRDLAIADFFTSRGMDFDLVQDKAAELADNDVVQALMYLEASKHPLFASISRSSYDVASIITHVAQVAMVTGCVIGIHHGMERAEFNKLDLPDINLD